MLLNIPFNHPFFPVKSMNFTDFLSAITSSINNPSPCILSGAITGFWLPAHLVCALGVEAFLVVVVG